MNNLFKTHTNPDMHPNMGLFISGTQEEEATNNFAEIVCMKKLSEDKHNPTYAHF